MTLRNLMMTGVLAWVYWLIEQEWLGWMGCVSLSWLTMEQVSLVWEWWMVDQELHHRGERTDEMLLILIDGGNGNRQNIPMTGDEAERQCGKRTKKHFVNIEGG